MSNGKVVIFDCQLLQTKAWHRGMGKYSARTIAAFLGNKKYFGKYEKIYLLFNDNLTYADDLSRYVKGLNSAEAIFLPLHVPRTDDQHSITTGQLKNKAILDEYIENNFGGKEVGFLITSLFLDEACPVFPSSTYNSLIYYDLIPLMYYRLYLGLGASEQYFTRFPILFDADQIFAISETVANDLVAFLGVPKEKVVDIRGASNRAESIVTSKPDLAIDEPFILMPTGGDPRKNNLNGVKGFSLFNEQNGSRYHLVITSFFTDSQKEELRQYSSDIIFTGNVSDNEVWWLFEQAEAVLFPAEYEGLGMPILEAIDADKLIVCSDIAVFREISTEAFFMFDPRDPEAISASLEEVSSATPEEIAAKKQHYKAIAAHYTWDSTAKTIDERMLKTKLSLQKRKPRVAFVTPNISQPSEEARYVARLYPHLRARYDVDFYYDLSSSCLPVRPNHFIFSTNVTFIEALTPKVYETYDLVVYVIGNSGASAATLQAALAMPGLVLLADENLAVTFDEASRLGVMSEERRKDEKGNHLESLRNVSRGIAMLVPGKGGKGMTQLGITVPKLAYPPGRARSMHGNIFVAIDTGREGAEWNVDLVNDIARLVDRSRVNFWVVARNKFPEKIRKLFDLSDVDLYEDVSDHEYLTLLGNSDAYIDARPGGSMTKLAPAFEAYRNGLDVFLGPVDGREGWWCDGVYVASEGATLRDAIYEWLIQKPTDIAKNKSIIRDDLSDLTEVIDTLISSKE